MRLEYHSSWDIALHAYTHQSLKQRTFIYCCAHIFVDISSKYVYDIMDQAVRTIFCMKDNRIILFSILGTDFLLFHDKDHTKFQLLTKKYNLNSSETIAARTQDYAYIFSATNLNTDLVVGDYFLHRNNTLYKVI